MIGRRTSPVAGSLLVLAAWLAPVGPADAQVGAFLDNLFGRKEQPAPAPEAVPAPAPEAAPAAPAAKKPATKPQKDAAREHGKAGDKSADKGADKAADKGDKAANDRTGSIKGAPARASAPEPKVAAVGAPTAAAALEPADPATVLAQANAYFNGLTTLTGNFMQISGDGRRIGGRLTLAKPGRLRFDYDQPSPLEVVADGQSVAVRDRKLNTQDTYFIAQTPLKFLLREKIDLARDLSVSEVTNEPGGIRIALEDRSTFGGTSKIQLYFDSEMKTLSQWRITDPQGYLTTVQLSNLQKGKTVDGTLFFINYGRPEDKAMAERIRQSQNP